MSFRVSVKGEGALKKRMRQSGAQYLHAFAGAFYMVGAVLMRKALRLTPADFGFLRQSHFITAPHLKKKTRVGFGVKYAVYVHEVKAKHQAPTQRKFLSDPYDEMLPGIRKLIAGFTQKNFKAGFTIKSIPKAAPTKPRPEPPPERIKALRKRRNRRNRKK